MTHTTIQDKVAKTAAFDGSSIDISGITGDWTVVLEVMDLVGSARFDFEESTDLFSTNTADMTVSVTGSTGASAGTGSPSNVRRFTFRKCDFPSAIFGIASALIRVSLVRLTGSSPSVTYQSWIES